jgi:hypothetical protein
MNRFLTDEEIERLTGRKKRSLQVRELTRLGIAHQVNVAGKIIVVAEALDKRPVTAFELGTVR